MADDRLPEDRENLWEEDYDADEDFDEDDYFNQTTDGQLDCMDPTNAYEGECTVLYLTLPGHDEIYDEEAIRNALSNITVTNRCYIVVSEHSTPPIPLLRVIWSFLAEQDDLATVMVDAPALPREAVTMEHVTELNIDVYETNMEGLAMLHNLHCPDLIQLGIDWIPTGITRMGLASRSVSQVIDLQNMTLPIFETARISLGPHTVLLPRLGRPCIDVMLQCNNVDNWNALRPWYEAQQNKECVRLHINFQDVALLDKVATWAGDFDQLPTCLFFGSVANARKDVLQEAFKAYHKARKQVPQLYMLRQRMLSGVIQTSQLRDYYANADITTLSKRIGNITLV